MTVRLRAAIVALVAGLACGFFGSVVANAPPAGIDLQGRALAGILPHVALVFTASCWWQSLIPLGVLALVLAEFVPIWRRRVFFSLVTTIVAWQASDALKNIFMRLRPDYWVLHHEKTWSYPSGHAMFAVVVFGLWSYYFATSELPRVWRIVLASGFALWGVAIIWSRLALGAHYVTDLIGGVLFGMTALAVAAAIAGRVPPMAHWHAKVPA